MFLPSVCAIKFFLLRKVWIYYPHNIIITNAILPLKYKITTNFFYKLILIFELNINILEFSMHIYNESGRNYFEIDLNSLRYS